MAEITPEKLDQLENNARGATPGPWQWYGNTKMCEIYLATVDRGRTFVMDFVRWGMRGAQPRFQLRKEGLGIMYPLGDLAKTQDPDGPVFEATHRKQFAGIGHPDARHIAASSPDVVLALVAEVRKLSKVRALLSVSGAGPIEPQHLINLIREVIDG